MRIRGQPSKTKPIFKVCARAFLYTQTCVDLVCIPFSESAADITSQFWPSMPIRESPRKAVDSAMI